MSVTTTDGWDPDQYNRFAVEREQPFFDLADLLEREGSPEVADLGCGDGGSPRNSTDGSVPSRPSASTAHRR